MIYLDNNATTSIASKIIDEAPLFMKEYWGNPSSSYRFGSRLKGIIEDSRETLTDLLCIPYESLVFTSGASEGISAVIASAVSKDKNKRHIVTSNVEHSAVLNSLKMLENDGYEISFVKVTEDGSLDLNDVENSLRKDTCLACFMSANNETGVLFPVNEIGRICQKKGVSFLCDATQSFLKQDFDVLKSGCDFAVFSGHKTHGPKGIGGLFIKKGSPFRPLICGGHQEHNRRGGTENVFGIWAWANAAKIVSQGIMEKRKAACRARDTFEKRILTGYQGAAINGNKIQRLCNTSNIYFPGIENSAFLILLDQNGLLASSGSACLTDSPEPSHVIKAMKGAEAANQSLRFSFSLQTNEKEAEEAACIVLRVANELSF